MLDTIVCDIADSSSRECGDLRYFDVSVNGQLLLKRDGRISFDVLVGTCLDDLERISRDVG